MPAVFYIILLLLMVGFLVYAFRRIKPGNVPDKETQKTILQQYVSFYRDLKPADKIRFEERIHSFLQRVKITGIRTHIEDMDRIFVAAGAVIPIFAFDNWDYRNINEVLIYPGRFTHDFRIEGVGRNTLGMVGSGAMHRVMILSKTDLRDGFLSEHSTSNTAIHEFVHLVDKSDGATDGLPEVLLKHSYALPWLHRMNEEIQKIVTGESDINPYGATGEAEFLAVAAEYFFTQPQRMRENHPELFRLLQQIFVPHQLDKI